MSASASDFAHDCSKFFDKTRAVLEPIFLPCLVQKLRIFSTSAKVMRVPFLLSKMSCKSFFETSDITRRLCREQNIKDVFEEAILQLWMAVKITVMCDALHFHPTFDGNNLDLIFSTETKLLSGTGSVSVSHPVCCSHPKKTPVPLNDFCHHLLPSDVPPGPKPCHPCQSPHCPLSSCVLLQASLQALLPAQRCGEKVIIHNGAIMLSSPPSKS
jgi:hypothetical protein